MQALFHCLPELNRRLFIRILAFFELVASTESNEVSREYLVYLLGPLLFYGQSDAIPEDGKKKKLKFDSDIVCDLLTMLLKCNKELFPTALTDLPPWESTRKKDSDLRASQSAELIPEIPDISETTEIVSEEESTPDSSEIKPNEKEEVMEDVETPLVVKRKRKRDVFKSSFLNLTKKYKSELEVTPPPNTQPVNYYIPAPVQVQ